jgi:uncharacterized membrane protein
MTDSVSKSDCGSAKEGELITRLEEAAQEIKGEVAEIRAIFTGPIPPPEMIGAYESALPGLANRIMMMAESEGQHRHAQEQKALDAEIETKRQALNADIESNKKLVDAHIREVWIGQVFALVIALVALCLGAYVAVQGYQFAGAVIGAGGLAGIVTAFLRGGRKDDSSKETDSNN